MTVVRRSAACAGVCWLIATSALAQEQLALSPPASEAEAEAAPAPTSEHAEATAQRGELAQGPGPLGPKGVVETEPQQRTPAGQTPPPEEVPEPDSWTKHVTIGGGGILWYYQPLQKHVDNRVEFFNVRLDADVTFGAFGFHIEPRFRDSKLRSFYDGPVWIQEAYGSYVPNEHLTIKVGKTYKHLGLFWDNSFYGNVQVYDGLKLDPDYGVSAEGTFGDRAGLNYWAQFFLIDGQTNVSLLGRDTFTIPGARRRNQGVINIEPFFKLGADGLLKVGISGEVFRADIPGAQDTVVRGAVHAKFTWRGLGVWGEVLHQQGKHVTGFPVAAVPATDDAAAIPGRASGKNDYFELGAEYTWEFLTLRYNVSAASYHDTHTVEWMHVPSLSAKIAQPLSLLAEVVFWDQHTGSTKVRLDRSLNILLLANF